MGKYIAKRLGYMVVVALILSLLMFLVYTMIPYDRAVVEVDSYKASLKNNPNAGELYEKKLAEKRHELGTDQNVFIRYLGWVGVAPINGKYQGILQGDFGWSYKYSRPAYDVLKAPMKNTIFINIFATILGLGITIPLVSSALSIGAASGTRRCRWVRLSVTRYLYSSRPLCLSGCSPLFSAGSRCRA